MKKLISLVLSVFILMNATMVFPLGITLETVETPIPGDEISLQAESESTGTLSTDMTAGDIDAELGTLVYYNNFEKDDVGHVSSKTKTMLGRYVFDNASEEKAGILADTAVGLTFFEGYLTNNTSVQTVATQDNASNKALQVINASGWRRIQLDIKDANGLATEGTYTLLADWYITDAFTGTANFGHLWNSSTTYRCDKTISQNTWGTSQTSYFVDGTTGHEALKNVTFQNLANGVAGDIYYIDNIRLYFKAAASKTTLTLDLNGHASATDMKNSGATITNGATVEVETGSLITVEPYVAGYTFMGWYVNNSKVTVADGEAMTLKAKWQAVAPGLNMLSGTAEAYDFEDGTRQLFTAGTNITAVDVGQITNASGANSNAFIATMTNKSGCNPQLKLPVTIEAGRYYDISFDTYSTREYGGDGVYGMNVSNNNVVFGALTKLTWMQYQQKFGGKASSELTLQYNMHATANATTYIYIDNISIVPYYKVTYVSFDGTETVKATEQLLPADGVLTIDNTVAPYGVYLQANGVGTYYTDSVTLENKDVVFYVCTQENAPVPKTTLTFDLNGHDSASDIKNPGATITNGSSVEVNRDSFIAVEPHIDGYTFMGWYVNNSKVTVATGEEMTLKAKWQAFAPGLNMLSGTAEAYDFEDGTRQLFTAGNNIISTDVNVIEKDGNASNKAFHAVSTAGGNISAQLKLPIVTEVGRYYQVTFDTYVTRQYGMEGFYGIGVSNNNQSWGKIGANTWKHYDTKISADKTGNPYILQYNTNGSSGSTSHGDYYIDNISIVPYYKVTYVSFDGTETVKAAEQLLPADGILTIDKTAAPYGVYLQANGTGALYTDTITLQNKDLTLYVNETAPKTVITFDLNGYDSVTDINGTTITNGDVIELDGGSLITVEPYVAGFTFMGWYDTNDSKVTVADGEVMALKAKWQAFAPGLNMLSGTADAYNFEDGTRQVLTAGNNIISTDVNVIAKDDNTQNKAFHAVSTAGGNISVQLNVPIVTEVGRYYQVTFDTYVTRQYGMQGFYGIGVSNNNQSWGTIGANTWKHYDTKISANKTGNPYILQYNTNGSTGSTSHGDYYIDNISIIPYYNVVYKNFDDKVLAEESVLPADGIYYFNAELLSSYGANGFYLTKDSNQKLTSVKLENKDLVLYVDEYKIKSYPYFSIRTTGTQSLRFSGSINTSLKNDVDEFGFLVAREQMLDGRELTIDMTAEKTQYGTALAVSQPAYVKGNPPSVDRLVLYQSAQAFFNKEIEEEAGEGWFNTAAMVGIPAAYYKDVLVGRTYAKVGDKYYYGEQVSNCIYDVALRVSQTESFKALPDTDPQKIAINNILAQGADKVSDDDAYELIVTSNFNGAKEGISSGWALDNRGGTPKNTLEGGYATLTDISNTEGTAVIREFNNITTGLVRLDFKFVVFGEDTDGAYFEFQNANGDSVYRVEDVNGKWTFANGKQLCDVNKETNIAVSLIIDLDNAKHTTIIDNKNYGTVSFDVKEGLNLQNFRIGTTNESTASVSLAYCHANVNYALNESFGTTAMYAVPYEWTFNKAYVDNTSKLVMQAGSTASKSFIHTSGKVVAETAFILSDGQALSYSIKSGNSVVAAITTNGFELLANGQTVYNCINNVWYRLRVELNTEDDTYLVKLNGRVIAQNIAFATAVDYVDSISISNSGTATMSMDDFKVFRTVEHDDYVPTPVNVASRDDYTIGINVCSIWKNGIHNGWSCITPYEELALGYYDEGVPETADWEIKYMVEHGIDFQSFCWFADQTDKPLKSPQNSAHLHDGYMNAKYSDMMKYCLIWEVVNGAKPANLQAWKDYYVPYLIENYFKDSRYMRIDNKLVFSVFGANRLLNEWGGTLGDHAGVKEALDYLEAQAMASIDCDGIIFLGCGDYDNVRTTMGFDGNFAYSWGRDGNTVDANKNGNIESTGTIATVPTVSVGYNDVAWYGNRSPLMSVADYRTTHEWVRDTFLKNNITHDWQDKFVMLSTWNEYGEGTYIMPGENNGGFGYLDVVKEVYTGTTAKSSLNVYPTSSQLSRITHLYPQNKSLLRKQYSVTEPTPVDSRTITNTNNISVTGTNGDVTYTDTGISGVTGNDCQIMLTLTTGSDRVNINTAKVVRIRAKIPAGECIQLFYTTSTDSSWDETKSKSITSVCNEMTDYIFDFTNDANWTGSLGKTVRIDPAAGSDVAFEFENTVYFYETGVTLMDKALINAPGIAAEYPRVYNGNAITLDNEIYIPYDPKMAVDFKLGSYYEWEKDTQSLTIYTNGHVVRYVVGSAGYSVDNVAKTLASPMSAYDGLPLIPVKSFCADVGFTVAVVDNVVNITTHQKNVIDENQAAVNARVNNKWEFNVVGDTENWSSSQMSLAVKDGYLSAFSFNSSTDPQLLLGKVVNLNASDYTKLKCRVRYEITTGNAPNSIQMFYTTDSSGAFSSDKCLTITLDSKTTNGEWVEYECDLANYSTWSGTIRQLRFDPFNGVGSMDIDYIYFE